MEANCSKVVNERREEKLVKEAPANFSTPQPRQIGSQSLKLYAAYPLRNDPLEIRILDVDISSAKESPRTGSPLRCSLRVVNIEASPPPYAAISYAWGDPSDVTDIEIDHQRHSITKSLDNALRAIVATKSFSIEGSKLIPLWADAICIDQDNNEEKSYQVSQMQRVYAAASITIVWLGLEYDGSEKAIALMTQWDTQWTGNVVDEIRANMQELLDDELKARDWKAYYAFLERPWFTRLWVVQELCSSTHVLYLCGHCTLSWSKLDDFVQCFGSGRFQSLYQIPAELQEVDRISIGQGNMSRMMDLISLKVHLSGTNYMANNTEPEGIFYLLASTQGMLCKDPRDRVYALLGLANTAGQDALLVPDYNNRTDQIWKELFVLYVQSTGKLLPLSYATPEVEFDPALPTWTARFISQNSAGDLSRNTFHRVLDGVWFSLVDPTGPRDKRACRASLDLMAHATFSKNLDRAYLRGFRLGIVAEIDTLTLQWGWSWEDMKCLLHRWRQFLGVEELGDNTGSWWRTLVQDLGSSNGDYSSPAPAEYGRILSALSERDEDIDQLLDDEPLLLSLGHVLGLACIGRQLYKLDQERFGLGPYRKNHSRFGVRAGDIICILFGGPVPYILRQVSDSEYILIGETYIHEVMHGEAMAGLKSGQYVEEKFALI